MSSAATENKVHLALHPPPTLCKDDPRATLSASEQKMYDEVLAHFTQTDPPYMLLNEKGELTDAEKFWLSRECILRYLRASKWKVAGAIQRLEATLLWRREFGVYDVVTADHVEPEAITGKEILFGYDTKGKPAFYMIPSRQNTTEATRQIQFAVWMLERGVDLMEPGVETIALLINFGDRGKNPSMSTAYSVLSILQNHYPERLGLSLIINVPFLVNAFFKVIMPLVDPITRQKVKFNPEIFKDGIFTKDQAMKEWGGEANFEYVHEKYWPDLVALCEKRSKTWMENWRALGGGVGASEWAYKTYQSDKIAVPEPVIAPVAPAAPPPAANDDAPAYTEKAGEPRAAPAPNGNAPHADGPSAAALSGPSVPTTNAAGIAAGGGDGAAASGDCGGSD